MGTRKPIDLESIRFESQAEAHYFFKEMLNRYIPGDIVSPEDSKHLASLLKRHAEYDQKIGAGIGHFEVIPGDYGTQCFAVVRNDGTKVDFSYVHCITQRPR